MKPHQIIGLIIMILGVVMFLFGVSMFSYSGPSLNPIVSEIGKYSFFLWLPTLIIGIVTIAWSSKRKNN
ncbi:MAG: hypothetical protein ACXVJG_18975 [Mucilaginibacter sp.]